MQSSQIKKRNRYTTSTARKDSTLKLVVGKEEGRTSTLAVLVVVSVRDLVVMVVEVKTSVSVTLITSSNSSLVVRTLLLTFSEMMMTSSEVATTTA